MAEAEPAALVLAAGSGVRLRPLTHMRPKVLCPVANQPLLDHAIARARTATTSVAVNASHGAAEIAAHVGDRAHLSVERGEALETAGAVGALRDWVDGRDVLVVNGDTWHQQDAALFLSGWDRTRVRIAVVEDAERPDFGPHRYVGMALIPWTIARDLPDTRAGLYPTALAPAWESGRLDLWVSEVPAYDCGTPAEYLAANLAACDGTSLVADGAMMEVAAVCSVVGQRAHVAGRIRSSVIWSDARVLPGEDLTAAIRAAPGFTVHVGQAARSSPVRWPETRVGVDREGDHE